MHTVTIGTEKKMVYYTVSVARSLSRCHSDCIKPAVEEDQRHCATSPVRRRAAQSHSAQLLFRFHVVRFSYL